MRQELFLVPGLCCPPSSLPTTEPSHWSRERKEEEKTGCAAPLSLHTPIHPRLTHMDMDRYTCGIISLAPQTQSARGYLSGALHEQQQQMITTPSAGHPCQSVSLGLCLPAMSMSMLTSRVSLRAAAKLLRAIGGRPAAAAASAHHLRGGQRRSKSETTRRSPQRRTYGLGHLLLPAACLPSDPPPYARTDASSLAWFNAFTDVEEPNPVNQGSAKR